MSKSKYTENQLWDFCQVETIIECSKCNSQDGCWGGDEYIAAPDFFKKGWRATPNNVYCPKCAKKYLKLKS